MNIDIDMTLKSLNASLKSKKLYPPGHPAIITPMRKAYGILSEALKSSPSFMVSIVNEGLVVEDMPIDQSEKLYPEILLSLSERKVDSLIFEKGMSEKELSTAIDMLSGEPKKGQELQKELHANGILHITFKSIPIGKKNVLEIYNGAVGTVKDVMNEVRLGKIPKSEPVENIVNEITETVLTDSNAIIGLTMIKNYDNYLYNHSVNVSVIALALGNAMNLNEGELHTIGVAALLHDIGKTGVSEDIIRKPGGLSSEEWDKLKEHPVLGFNIVKRMDNLNDLVSRIVHEHHIKYDNSGYPQTDQSVHPLSQIVTISDAYDALTTLRVYQKPHNPVDAIKVMMNFSGRHFDPEIFKTFVNMIGLYPVGTMVRLSTNEVAVVTKVNPESTETPVVKTVFNADGKELESPYEINLAQADSLKIISTVNPSVMKIDLAAFFEKEAAATAN